MEKDLTRGSVGATMLKFALPMIFGNMLQQCYNIADTVIVGRACGEDALAAVGSAYTLMTFITSVIIGLCMGSGAVFSACFGRGDRQSLRSGAVASFGFIAAVTVVMNIAVVALGDNLLRLLRVPEGVLPLMSDYIGVIYTGIAFIFLYNFFAFLLRSCGNSSVPLIFLAISAVINIALDIVFVVSFDFGVKGAAAATVIAQAASGLGLAAYTLIKQPELRPTRHDFAASRGLMPGVVRHSFAASVQQSVMNFGILMIQGLVNSFGATVMAAFAAAVKVDTFAYMPAQEFGNAYSLFISQNNAAGRADRVKEGTRRAVALSVAFCAVVSVAVFAFAPQLIGVFVDEPSAALVATGAQYLRIEGSCYFAIGVLFLLYGYYRGIEKPEMSLVLTVISLGTRVLLAYLLAPIKAVGVLGIWWAIPIGWFLADAVGLAFMKKNTSKRR